MIYEHLSFTVPKGRILVTVWERTVRARPPLSNILSGYVKTPSRTEGAHLRTRRSRTMTPALLCVAISRQAHRRSCAIPIHDHQRDREILPQLFSPGQWKKESLRDELMNKSESSPHGPTLSRVSPADNVHQVAPRTDFSHRTRNLLVRDDLLISGLDSRLIASPVCRIISATMPVQKGKTVFLTFAYHSGHGTACLTTASSMDYGKIQIQKPIGRTTAKKDAPTPPRYTFTIPEGQRTTCIR